MIMDILISACIFCIILFFYLHIFYQLKTSNDLEVYEIETISKEAFEDACNLRQPIVFEYANSTHDLIDKCRFSSLLSSCGAFDVNIRNMKEDAEDAELHIPIQLNRCANIIHHDVNSTYLTENNYDFLEDSGLNNIYKNNDSYLRPYMASKCMYDIMSASNNCHTHLKYEVNYRNYFLVTEGSIKITLIPPKSTRYLHPIDDYDNFEFRSPIHPWNVQSQYKTDFDKVKTVELVLASHKMIYIPAYWWYSIQFMNSSTTVCAFKYRTHMNELSIVPKTIMKLLQHLNTKREIVKKMIPTADNNMTDVTDSSHTINIAVPPIILIHPLTAESEIKYSNVEESEIKYSNVEESEIKYSNVEESEIKYSNVKESEIKNSNVKESEIKNSNVEEADSEIKYSNVEESEIKNSNVEESEIKYSNVEEAEIKNSNVEESEIKNSNVEGSEIKYSNQGI